MPLISVYSKKEPRKRISRKQQTIDVDYEEQCNAINFSGYYPPKYDMLDLIIRQKESGGVLDAQKAPLQDERTCKQIFFSNMDKLHSFHQSYIQTRYTLMRIALKIKKGQKPTELENLYTEACAELLDNPHHFYHREKYVDYWHTSPEDHQELTYIEKVVYLETLEGLREDLLEKYGEQAGINRRETETSAMEVQIRALQDLLGGHADQLAKTHSEHAASMSMVGLAKALGLGMISPSSPAQRNLIVSASDEIGNSDSTGSNWKDEKLSSAADETNATTVMPNIAVLAASTQREDSQAQDCSFDFVKTMNSLVLLSLSEKVTLATRETISATPSGGKNLTEVKRRSLPSEASKMP